MEQAFRDPKIIKAVMWASRPFRKRLSLDQRKTAFIDALIYVIRTHPGRRETLRSAMVRVIRWKCLEAIHKERQRQLRFITNWDMDRLPDLTVNDHSHEIIELARQMGEMRSYILTEHVLNERSFGDLGKELGYSGESIRLFYHQTVNHLSGVLSEE